MPTLQWSQSTLAPVSQVMVSTFLGRNFLNSYVLLHTVIIHEKSFILLYSVTVADTFSPWPPKPCTYYLYHFVPPLARQGGTSPYQGWAGELQLAVATRRPAGLQVSGDTVHSVHSVHSIQYVLYLYSPQADHAWGVGCGTR